jgi:hypothetical protein
MKLSDFIKVSENSKKTHISVYKTTHEALRAFAFVKGVTIFTATQYLLTKALAEEYEEDNKDKG